MNILQINSSARSSGSISGQLADEIVADLLLKTPQAKLTRIDLASNPVTALDEAGLGALMSDAATRTQEQAARVNEYDARIAEIQAADVLVLAVPMYNFGVTTQLKNWIDAISRARVTFQYTEKGPEGLLTGKKVYVALSRGGIHRDQPSDILVPYLRTVLGFLGMTDVQFVYAEGLGYGDDYVTKALASARAEIAALA
ncbi:MAG: NAD(P)H-dependent oxidoreductase [Formivibrio sp.]|nr:NAD(P)H-dependent oxidoreductase [Formivibrio sp.]